MGNANLAVSDSSASVQPASATVQGTSESAQVENLSLARNAKLGLFHIGSAMADILALGVWNRIVIADLGLAATPIALLVALRYFFAPLSIWVGQRSDVGPWRGYRRLPYIWGGRLVVVLSYFLMGLGTVLLAENRNSVAGWVGLVIAFTMFSVGSAFSGTTFLALLHDRAPNHQRTRVVSVVWFFLIAGFPIAGIAYGALLPHFTRDGFVTLFTVAPLIMGLLWFVSVLGEEKPVRAAPKQESVPTLAQRSFLQDLRGAWASPQTRIFFAFLGLTTIFFYAQDIILEPFGAQVFGMSTAVTSRFSSYWGSTTLVAIVASLLLTRRFPKTVNTLSLSRWGVITLVFTFGLLFVSAVAQVRPLVTWGLVALGIGLGMWTVGTLGLMMDMTRVWGAGLYLSLWTVSETLARGIGSVFGGLIRDLGLALSGQLSLAYGAVFLLQAVGFALTLILLSRVSIEAFLRQAPAVETVFSKAMD